MRLSKKAQTSYGLLITLPALAAVAFCGHSDSSGSLLLASDIAGSAITAHAPRGAGAGDCAPPPSCPGCCWCCILREQAAWQAHRSVLAHPVAQQYQACLMVLKIALALSVLARFASTVWWLFARTIMDDARADCI